MGKASIWFNDFASHPFRTAIHPLKLAMYTIWRDERMGEGKFGLEANSMSFHENA